MPIVADDIMINFGDDRAPAPIKVLAEFSEMTQVLLFTYH